MLGCFRLVLSAVIVVVAALGAAAFFATRPQLGPTDLSEIPVSEHAHSELNVHLDRIDAQISQSRKTGIAIPIHISISEGELSSKIDAWSKTKLFGEFRNFRTHFKNDVIVVVGTISVGRLDFQFRSDVWLRIETGEQSLKLLRVQIGDLFVPEPIRNSLVALIQRSVEAGFPRPPIDIETLLFSEDTLVVSGSTRG